MRAGLAGHVDAARRVPAATRSTPSRARHVDDVQRAAGLPRERDRPRDRLASRPRSGASRGSRASSRRPASRRRGGAGGRSAAGLSAWTATGRPSARGRAPSRRAASRRRQAGKSSMPESAMNALKPTTPRAASSSSCSRLPGTSPPHSATSTRAAPRAAAIFSVQRRAVDRRRRGVERHVDRARRARRPPAPRCRWRSPPTRRGPGR